MALLADDQSYSKHEKYGVEVTAAVAGGMDRNTHLVMYVEWTLEVQQNMSAEDLKKHLSDIGNKIQTLISVLSDFTFAMIMACQCTTQDGGSGLRDLDA